MASVQAISGILLSPGNSPPRLEDSWPLPSGNFFLKEIEQPICVTDELRQVFTDHRAPKVPIRLIKLRLFSELKTSSRSSLQLVQCWAQKEPREVCEEQKKQRGRTVTFKHRSKITAEIYLCPSEIYWEKNAKSHKELYK